MKNTGISYETLTKYIFQEILEQDQVKTIQVQHDVTIQGKTILHQIDVYWEFEVGGIKYITIVQAKDWQYPVNQGELLKFKGILDDLPGQPKGIFVTRTGYQSGAKEFAERNGIILYELREPTQEDWEGRVKTIIIDLIAFVSNSSNTKPAPDNEWIKKERQSLNISDKELIKIQISGLTNEIKLYNEQGIEIGTIEDIVKSFYPSNYQEIQPIDKCYEFPNPTFIKTGNSIFPRIKLKGIKSTISVSKIATQIRINGEEIVGFILKNVINNSHQTFDKKLKSLKRLDGL